MTFNPTKAAELVRMAMESRRCKECLGDGFKAYSDTTCGRGGGGGQMITVADCHRCRGQGWICAVDISALAEQLSFAMQEIERLRGLNPVARVFDYAHQENERLRGEIQTAQQERDSLQAALDAALQNRIGDERLIDVMSRRYGREARRWEANHEQRKQERDAARVEVERMRPVYDVAVSIRECARKPDAAKGLRGQALFQALFDAIDTTLTANREGEHE